jgi:hypothetical protein
MSDLRTDRDFEDALAAWMDKVAPSRPPTRLLEGTFSRTMGSRQVRSFPWNRTIRVEAPGRTATTWAAWPLIALVGVLLAAAILIGLVGSQGRVPGPAPSATATAGPTSARTATASLPAAILVSPEATIPLLSPIRVVADGMAIWVLAPGRVDKIDTQTNTIVGSVAIGETTDAYNGLAAGSAALWATDSTAGVVDRVDPATLKLVAKIPAGSAPKGVVATPGEVWVADEHGGSVLPVDPATDGAGTPIMVGPTGTSGPQWLGNGLGSLWVGIPNKGTIARVDAGAGQVVATITAPEGTEPCGGIAVGTAAVWITSCSHGSLLTRIDPATNLVSVTVDLGGNGYNPTLINDAPWISVDVGSGDAGFLARVSPATNTIDHVLVPGTNFGGGGDIVVAAGSVWVVDGYHNVVLRLPLAAFEP